MITPAQILCFQNEFARVSAETGIKDTIGGFGRGKYLDFRENLLKSPKVEKNEENRISENLK